MSLRSVEESTKVTVVVPSLGDRPALLARTLRSIAAQEHASVELLVVDASGEDRVRGLLDGSELVRVVVANQRLTAGAARQLGTREASADWIAYCDDDDLWAPTKLQKQLEAAGDARPWVFTGLVCFAADRSIIWSAAASLAEDMHAALLKGNRVPGGGSSCLVHRDLVDEVGGWDPELRNSEDWDLFIRLSRIAPAAYVHAPLVAYRLHDHSKSLNVGRIRLSHEIIYAKYGLDLDSLPSLDWMYRRELLAQRFEHARSVFGELPERSWSSRVLRVMSAVAPQRTSRWLLSREVSRSPEGWIDEARHWITALESDSNR